MPPQKLSTPTSANNAQEPQLPGHSALQSWPKLHRVISAQVKPLPSFLDAIEPPPSNDDKATGSTSQVRYYVIL